MFSNSNGVEKMSHAGGVNGHRALLSLYPELGAGIALVSNSYRGKQWSNLVEKEFAKLFFGLNPPPKVPNEKMEMDLQEYVGEYKSKLVHLHLVVENDKLLVFSKMQKGVHKNPSQSDPPGQRIRFYEKDKYLVDIPGCEDDNGQFLRNHSGEIIYLRGTGSRLYVRSNL